MASDTTFNESVDSGPQPHRLQDHTYPSVTVPAPTNAGVTAQQPATSTSDAAQPAPTGDQRHVVILSADDEAWAISLCSLPQEIIQHSAVLDAAYNDLMTSFFDKLKITHTERLSDLDACRASVNNAVQKWMVGVHERSDKLGSNPGASSYNTAVDSVRLLSNTLRRDVNRAEEKFLASKRSHDARVEQHAAKIKQMLEDGIRDAIQIFLQGCVRSCLRYVGSAGDLDPWLSQFSSRAMDFQSHVLSRTAEFCDLPMELETAAVLQQLEMFIATARVLPSTCPLSYPVATPRTQPMIRPAPVPGAEKNKSKDATVKTSTTSTGSSKTAATSTSKATTASCGGAAVTASTNPGRHEAASSTSQIQPSLSAGSAPSVTLLPGSYSYTSIMTRGFTPSSQGGAPVLERATKFGVTTPPAITRVAGSRAPTAPVQTVAPSTTTGTVTSALSTSTPGGGTSLNPIDCQPLGTKRPHLSTPKKIVEAPEEVITLDYEPAPIPVFTLDDDDDDLNKLTIDDAKPEERSPIVVPEKRARVRGSPAMAKGVAAARANIGFAVIQKSQAEAAAKAYADNTLGSVSSSSDDPESRSTAVAKQSKPAKKRKTKKKRDSAKSQPRVRTSSDDDDDNAGGTALSSNVEGLLKSLKRNVTVESIHAKAHDEDFDFIKELRRTYGLPSAGMNQDEISGFLPSVVKYQANRMKDPYLRQDHIWTLDEVVAAMNASLADPETVDNKLARTQWRRARRQLNDCRSTTPMPECHECKGLMPRVYPKYVTRVFAKSDGKPLVNNAKMVGDEFKRVVLGLAKLHKPKAISRRQENKIDGGSICAWCSLSLSNHESANNHIRVHWRMALMCAICSHVEVNAHEMILHGRDEHGLQVP